MKKGVFQSLLASMLLLLSQYVVAAPKVIVSIPPLHSLVAGVMDGVGSPVLLGDSDNQSSTLSLTNKLHLVTADMVVWVGPGYEKALAQTVENELPALKPNMFALSHFLPLLPKGGIDLDKVNDPENRQAHRDLVFWMDPKLAVMAVRRITLKLSKLDPDNLETYLDNEINVVTRIKKMAHEMSSSLAPLRGSLTKQDQIPAYLAWRFGLLERIERDSSQVAFDHSKSSFQCEHLRHVNLQQEKYLIADVKGSDLPLGQDLYFQLMARQVKVLTQCVPKPNSAANLGGEFHSS